MKRYIKGILIFSFAIEFVIAFTSVFFIRQWPDSIILIVFGVLAGLTFMVISINEIILSAKIKNSEKIMWVICLIFLTNIAGLLYLIYSRKRII
jgi:uncharacterized protein with PQ loop repeat